MNERNVYTVLTLHGVDVVTKMNMIVLVLTARHSLGRGRSKRQAPDRVGGHLPRLLSGAHPARAQRRRGAVAEQAAVPRHEQAAATAAARCATTHHRQAKRGNYIS